MTTIKDAAISFESKIVQNITALKSIPVSLEIKQQIGTDSNGAEYSYYFVEFNDDRYRVPLSVLNSLKAILEKKPSLQNFAVSKTGEGRNTKYTVIPLD